MSGKSGGGSPSLEQVARNLTDYCTSRVFSDLSVLLRMLSSSDQQRMILSILYAAKKGHLPQIGLTLEELGSTLLLQDMLSLLSVNSLHVGLRLYSPSETSPYGSAQEDGVLLTGGALLSLPLTAPSFLRTIRLPSYANGAGDPTSLMTLNVGLM